MSRPIHGTGKRQYVPRFVQAPQSGLARLDRIVPRLGGVAVVLAVPAFLATIVLPYLVIPDELSVELWLQFAGIVTGASACGAAGSVLSTRRAVRVGYLDLWTARSARVGLGGACVVSTVSGIVAIVLFVLLVDFDGIGWAYIAALVSAVAINYVCFIKMRPLLWSAPYVLQYRGYRIAPWEKRR